MLVNVDPWYRLSFGTLWLVYFAVRLFFQRQVKGSTGYQRVNELEERRLFGLFAFGFLLLPLYFLTHWIDFAAGPLPGGLRWFSAGVAALGIVIFGWAHQALGQNWTAVLALRPAAEHQLVVDGPYRWVRHPMYTAFFLIGLGLAGLSANALVAAFYLIPLTWLYLRRVAAEENMLTERFGETYMAYMRRTGRLWPRWKR